MANQNFDEENSKISLVPGPNTLAPYMANVEPRQDKLPNQPTTQNDRADKSAGPAS